MRQPPALGRDKIRQANQSAVFKAIHEHGPISRSDLARELRLSAAAVTSITSHFIASGLVYEATQGEAAQGAANGVGRRPIPLAVDYDHGYVFGVKISNTSVTAALTNLRAEVLAWRTVPLAGHDVASVIGTIGATLESLQAEHRLPAGRVMGLGVNLPGIVDTPAGRVRASPLLGWEDSPLAQLLEERLGLPALIENDVNALTAAAAWFGAGKGHSDFLVLTLGRGVGLGIVVNGQVYRGPRGGAGEFGHTLLDLSAAAGSPQAQATVESFLSDAALLERARQNVPNLPERATPETLLRVAQDGDPEALELFEQAGTVLGRALANLVNIFAPSLIILGGEGMRAAPLLLPPARRALAAHSFGDLGRRLELVVDAWGDEAWAQGAAGLAAGRFLTETAPFLGGDPQPKPAPAPNSRPIS